MTDAVPPRGEVWCLRCSAWRPAVWVPRSLRRTVHPDDGRTFERGPWLSVVWSLVVEGWRCALCHPDPSPRARSLGRMSLPDVTPEAVALARRCLHVEPYNSHLHAVVYVRPGGDLAVHGITLGMCRPSETAGKVEYIAHALAAFADVCLAHERAKRTAPV